MPQRSARPGKGLGKYLLSPQPREMFGLLDLIASESPESRFPRTIERTPDGNLAIALDALGSIRDEKGRDVPKVIYFSEMLGMSTTIVSEPDLTTVPIHDTLRPHWKRFDPVRFRIGQNASGRGEFGGFAQPSSNAERMCYILGAQTVGSAKCLLDSLTRFLARGICVRPLECEEGAGPFRYLWSIEGEISLALLQSVERAWYGPRQQPGPIHVYFQWPWTTGVSRQFLRRVDWGEDCGTLLAGPDDPLQLFLCMHPETTFAPLVDYADLSVGSVVAVENLDAKTEEEIPFTVKVRLIDRQDRGQSLTGRIAEIQRQIQHLHELEEHLKIAATAPVDDDSFSQPLYIYYDERQQEQVPLEIQRLLVEWSDQQGDLQNVYYHRIHAASLDREDTLRGVAHLITTSAAIARSSPNSLGLKTLAHRLSAYRPQGRGRPSCFTLLKRWDRVGLRLFVPYDRMRWRLKLYPDFPATPASARKLADALGLSAEPLEEWCTILVPAVEDKVHACLVRTRPAPNAPAPETAFRPLFDAIRWECAADVGLSTQTLPERHGARAVAALQESLSRDIENALEHEFHLALSGLETDLKHCSQELVSRQNEAAKLKIVLGEIATLRAASVRRLDDLARFLDSTGPDQIVKQMRSSISSQNEVERVLAALDSTIQSTNSLKQRCQALKDEIQVQLSRK